MAQRLTFVYRDDDSEHILQGGDRDRFLASGEVGINDGTRTLSDGTVVTTNLVRITPPSTLPPKPPKPIPIPDPWWMQPIPGEKDLSGHIGLIGGDINLGKRWIYLTSSPTVWFIRGEITILIRGSAEAAGIYGQGMLSHFSVWGSGALKEDPYEFYVETATNTNSGNVGEPFTRVSAVFVPHRDTRYLAVGAKVYGMPNTGAFRSQYLRKWMLEEAPVGATVPSPKYHQAREVVAKVRPDRLNWSVNPGFYVDTSSWTGVTRVAWTPAFSDQGGQVTLGATAVTTASHIVPVVTTGKTYSVSVKVSATSPVNVLQKVTGATVVSRQEPVITPDGVVLRIKVIPTAGTMTLDYILTSGPSGATITFYDMLVERVEDWNRPYFDGSTNPDTLWETGGVSGKSRSYLYRNRLERYAALQRILEENVPMGIGIAEPVFGTLPLD